VIARLHHRRTDVLRDASGFASRNVAAANRVEQRRLTVIDVTHDGDDRRTELLIFLVFCQFDFPDGFFFEGQRAGCGAEFACQLFGQLQVESLVDGSQNLAVE